MKDTNQHVLPMREILPKYAISLGQGGESDKSKYGQIP